MDDYDFYQIFAMSGINSEHHNLPTYEFLILNFCGIVTAILKILTTQNCSSNGDWTEIHETWWSYRYMFLVGPKVFNFVVKGAKVIF
jgi:hypothetical protein